MVQQILSTANQLKRDLRQEAREKNEEFEVVRWVVLAGTSYIQRMKKYAARINRSMKMHKIKLELVESTGQSIGSILFNNNAKSPDKSFGCSNSCHLCGEKSEEVVSPTNGRSYLISKSLNCKDRGIYSIVCACTSLYTGKTTTSFAQRFKEHFSSTSSAVFDHSKSCMMGSSMKDFRIQFLESMHSRGKYSLSEREYLWNERLRGVLNIQKTLKK